MYTFWLVRWFTRRARVRRLDHAHDLPSGDRRSLVVTPDVQRIREEWQL